MNSGPRPDLTEARLIRGSPHPILSSCEESWHWGKSWQGRPLWKGHQGDAALAMVALILALGGVYGVMAYTVSQRTQELGIRMSLGAQRRNLRYMVVRQGTALALMGIVIGTGGGPGADPESFPVPFRSEPLRPPDLHFPGRRPVFRRFGGNPLLGPTSHSRGPGGDAQDGVTGLSLFHMSTCSFHLPSTSLFQMWTFFVFCQRASAPTE